MPVETFDPSKVVDLRNALGQGLVSAIFRGAIDFVSGNGQPWYYYAGVFSGATAAATGIDGASATLFVAANLVQAYVLKGPESGNIRIFVDGVEQGVIDLEASSEAWELVTLVIDPLGTIFKRVDIVNEVGLAGFSFFAMSSILATHDTEIPQIRDRTEIIMPYVTLAFRCQDDEASTRDATLPIRVPTGATLAQLQTYADAIAPEIDAQTESQITEILVSIPLTVVAGLKAAPVAGAFNERGGLITFDTTGPRADSVWIPAMSKSIMPGDSFSLVDAAVAAFITRLTTATTAANIRPRSKDDYNYTAARRGVKSVRK